MMWKNWTSPPLAMKLMFRKYLYFFKIERLDWRNHNADVYFQLVQNGDTITKSKLKKKIGSVKTLDIMLDGDIEDKMPTLQVFETKKLGRNKLLHEAELATFDTVEDNVPCDLTFTFLNLTIRGTFVVMVSRSSTSNASLNERTESPEVVAEPNVESFEFVKRERSRRVK